MKIFQLLCGTAISYTILNKINTASKQIHRKVDRSAAMEILTNALEYLKKYHSDDGCSSILIDAKWTASDTDFELTMCKENSIFSWWKITVQLWDNLRSLQMILRPNSKLIEFFQVHFGCITTVTEGEVLAAAATQHTLQISIQRK
jgi:hypothetical protein